MDLGILKEFNLTANEIAIFRALITGGTQSATEIAKKTGLNRPYVYYALDRLLEKGYISQIHLKAKKHYQAQAFKDITALEELKLEQLKQSLKKLEQLRKPSETTVEVLKGSYSVKNVFKRIVAEVKPKGEILYLGLDEHIMESLEPIYLRKILNQFKEKKITERIIIKRGGKQLSYAKTSQYKHLPATIIGDTARIILRSTVIDILYEQPLYAIITNSENMATAARKQFNVFWKIARTA